jgi:hypothetical protein
MTYPQDPHQQPEPPQQPPPTQAGQYPPPGLSPQAAPKKGMSTGKVLAIIGAGSFALYCVGGVIAAATSDSGKAGYKAAIGATTPTAEPATPTLAATPTRAATPAAPAPPTKAAIPTVHDRQICRVTDYGGSYYLLVTSAAEHDFRACGGATLYPGTLDNLFAVPNMDRRCILPSESIGFFHALVAVYSDTVPADRSAAKAFCDTYKGTNA